MTVPIICFDLDGTLLDKNGKIHPEDIEILKNNKDVLFVPCTGRPLESVELMFHKNGLFLDGPMPFASVTQNGSAIHKAGGEIFQYHAFPMDIQERLLDIFELFPDESFMWMERDRTLLVHPNDFGSYWMDRFSTPWEPYDESCRNNLFGKATCLSSNRKTFEDLTEYIKDLPLEIGVNLSSIYDINPRGITKRSGVLSLLEYYKDNGAPIYAAGDGENDLDLFTLADLSFSPNTSPAAVREKSDYILNITQNGLLTPMLEAAGCSI
jgi:5-amino-6-(5-phospho-D-ribitylamino)uracil phosphatase